MKKILCLVDLDGTSNGAVEYAANLARHSGAELILLHVLPLPTYHEIAGVESGHTETSEEREKESYLKLLNYQTHVEDEFGIPCMSMLKTDVMNLSKGVRNELEQGDYDLVVMGTNGAENLRQFFFGTHAEKLAKKVSLPLLIIPDGYVFSEPKQVVYATDYESEDVSVVKQIMEITSDFEPAITILHVSEKASHVSDLVYCSIKNELEDALDNPMIRCQRIFEKDVRTGIHDFVKTENKDMLVLLSKNHSLPEKLTRKGLIRDIVNTATYPVLIIHSSVRGIFPGIIPPDVVF